MSKNRLLEHFLLSFLLISDNFRVCTYDRGGGRSHLWHAGRGPENQVGYMQIFSGQSLLWNWFNLFVWIFRIQVNNQFLCNPIIRELKDAYCQCANRLFVIFHSLFVAIVCCICTETRNIELNEYKCEYNKRYFSICWKQEFYASIGDFSYIQYR